MDDITILKRLILSKLIRGNIWGGKHTPLNFIKRGIPEHYRNSHKGQKTFAEVLKELNNEELIILTLKRTGKGSDEHISLNPRKVYEIRQLLEKEQPDR
ncbi:hypothetical protein HYU19_04210 [Candidatus Woesearchaeota archaeon]|nr:hypothetical protein [Candidatus Woesearchaeota archaeon]